MELFRLLGTVAIDNTEANSALADTSAAANDTADETESAFAKIGGVARTLALGMGAAGLAIGGAFVGVIESTREYRQQMGLLEAAFLTAGHSSEEAKQTYSDLNAVLGDSGQAVEASQHLALIADNEKELSNLTHILTGVYARYGDSLPLEGLAEGINHTAELGEVQGSLADALEWAGISVEDFNEQLAECSSEEERQDLIVKTLDKTYSKAADQYKETNKDVMEAQKAQERLTDAMAEVGRVGEPIMTAIKDAVASMAENVAPAIQSIIDKVREAAKWVKDNEDTVHTWIAVILGAGTAIGTFLLILNWGAIMTAAANAINVVRTAILAMNLAILANPIALIVAALAGLVVAFVYLWNNVEGFRKFWIDAWENIQKYARKAWQGIKDIWNGTKEYFSGLWQGIKDTFKSVTSWFSNLFKGAWNAVKNAFASWGTFFGGLWDKIKSKFSSIGSTLGSSISNAVKSGLNKVLGAVESTINKGIDLINSAIRLANKIPGVNVGTVKRLSLPRLARGGVLEKGQVGLLEGTGAEAVVPLEHNRAWLTRVAEDLNELQQTDRQPKNNEALNVRLEKIIELLENMLGMRIYLDSGVLVGELAPAIDTRLGQIYRHTGRGH